ncbi:hypothetical protein GGP91_003037 [Salinibacter ruber]|jgi:hypothetical protein|nr:hypothetical protein [Salinibacter ruber]MBB4062072.1 hypothetical protein [Salinibacter ruber]MBB4068966.1 hypothetical protein [Salinibacter ruber]MCS3612454.1 hypothetical protein [Salinibacter ruber]MCS3614276.1 hypothetical protein [Salinibacter ruber]MCS3626308.1 hypothetical protein [Salinibacter ruber]
MHSLPRTILAALLVGLCVGALPAQAQRTSGAAGLGVQAGEPSGVTLKIYNADAPSYDFLAAWSFNDFVFLNAHALFEHRLSAQNIEQPVHWFVGPGAYVGVYDEAQSEAGLGVSGRVGLDILIDERFEIYIQATPRFELVRETEPSIGGGLGLRYYF